MLGWAEFLLKISGVSGRERVSISLLPYTTDSASTLMWVAEVFALGEKGRAPVAPE